MKKFSMFLLSLLVGFMLISLGACEKEEGPAESAGKKIDQGVEETMEKGKDAVEKGKEDVEEKMGMEDHADDTGEKTDQAMEHSN